MDRWLSNNTIAKVIALAVALILWAMVHVDTDTPTMTRNTQGNQTITNLSVEPYGFDEDKYVLKSVDPQRVSVEISGQRSQLTSLLSSSEYQVKLDLSNISGPGQYKVPLTFDPPSGVQLLSISPARVTVTIEEKVTKNFNAVVLTTGTPAESYAELDPIFENGNEVQVTLPASEMKQVQKIQGEMSIDGATETVSSTLKLIAYSNNGEVLEDAVITPASLKVQIPISSSLSSKTLPLNVSYSGELPDGLALSDVQGNAKQVTLYGPEEVLKELDSYPPVALDLGEISEEGATTYTEKLAPPSGVSRIVPASVNYTVKVVPYQQKTIAGVPVNIVGAAENAEAVLTSPASRTVSVTVEGAPDLLTAIGPDDIKLTADVSGLDAGKHDVELKVELPDYIRMSRESALSVAVEITQTEEKPADPEETPSTAPTNTEEEPETDSGGESTPPADTDEPQTETPADPGNTVEPPADTEETPPPAEDEGGTQEPDVNPEENSGDSTPGDSAPGAGTPDAGTGAGAETTP
ncbi:CdaR family protein [Saccharibacillus sp. CPCC 101409]|uniref:CdaR family protein n=1 Tax=Saccharibacillus sp. CPCC 101409 TaxID=3058041 RepID=UPI002671B576|nr:CdaR family protein [Saccharibacillus sp. CPCC 101409]MDO3413356.1 CdaR family protein [Saccharibacillus sp. CPCC 101409]